MSLFKVKEFWQTKCGVDEEFDGSAIAVDTLNNASVVCLGSISGFLRVYSPSSSAGYDVKDLVAEQDLSSPILAVLIGKFVPNSSSRAIAVLHPKRLCVFGLKANRIGNHQGADFACI